ncbi:MAG: MarR family transcriptional regulator [Pirellulales bacterium]|nr:MarR family transcriptional regulator [Pirellulales bacterium]
MNRRAATVAIELPRSAGSIPRWVAVLENLAASARGIRHGLARTLAGRDVGESQFSILWSCQQAQRVGISQSELAQRLAISTAHISGLVEQLRRAGWLEGQRDPQDRRRQVWRTTPAGQALCELLLDDITTWLARRGAALADIDHDQLNDLATRLGAALADDAVPALLATPAESTHKAKDQRLAEPSAQRHRKRGAA